VRRSALIDAASEVPALASVWTRRCLSPCDGESALPGPMSALPTRPCRSSHAERSTTAAVARRAGLTCSMLATMALASAETASQLACSKLQLPMQTCRE